MLNNIIAHFIGVGIGLAGLRLVLGARRASIIAVSLIPFEVGFWYGVYCCTNL